MISKIIEKFKNIILGKEEGRDRVMEAKEIPQAQMEQSPRGEVRTTEETPAAPDAEKRNEPPGSMGGLV